VSSIVSSTPSAVPLAPAMLLRMSLRTTAVLGFVGAAVHVVTGEHRRRCDGAQHA
jgi:hypothetical protein